MIVQRTTLVFRVDQATDQVIAHRTLGATLLHNLLDHAIQGFRCLHRCTTRGGSLLRIDLRTSQDSQRPCCILLDLFRTILRKSNQRIDHPDRKIEGKFHEIRTLAGHHGLQIFLANHPINPGFLPAVDRFRHEHRLQQITDALVRIAVHGGQNQAVKERTQALSDEATGEIGAIAHDSHHVSVLEQGEGRPIGINTGNRRHAQALHEVILQNRRFLAHLAIHGVQIDIGATVVVRNVGEHLLQVALSLGGHRRLLFYCDWSETQPYRGLRLMRHLSHGREIIEQFFTF
ncbi:hypothetical protein D3C81_1121130 [compost metagenome]